MSPLIAVRHRHNLDQVNLLEVVYTNDKENHLVKDEEEDSVEDSAKYELAKEESEEENTSNFKMKSEEEEESTNETIC